MKDGIINGDGTSRAIKATLPATYEEFKAACENGTQLLDILFNAAGWEQQPDFLNKANLLTDETVTLYGKDASALPNDIFAILSKAVLSDGSGLQTVSGSKIQPAKFIVGQFTGNGKFNGEDAAISITFPETPIIVFIWLPGNISPVYALTGSLGVFFPSFLSENYQSYGYAAIDRNSGGLTRGLLDYAKFNFSSKTLSFYSTDSDYNQFNGEGLIYKYIAVFMEEA